MHVVTRRHLLEAEAKYPDAAREIKVWYKIASEARWQNFLDVLTVFPDADAVDGYLVFNVRHNRYRLITIAHYARVRDGRLTHGHLYIRSFLAHREYDVRRNWDKGVKR